MSDDLRTPGTMSPQGDQFPLESGTDPGRHTGSDHRSGNRTCDRRDGWRDYRNRGRQPTQGPDLLDSLGVVVPAIDNGFR